MGSVKTGKDKRTFGKSVVLAAEDSVLAEKRYCQLRRTNLSSKIAITEPWERSGQKIQKLVGVRMRY
ncbi:hypothetical protein BaRGS_00037198 [Batillaria attramentaria]|uniref:Uncharacterized protein n=1 Tax=Batillaria attramentaria TaxID=370345 RepID=A0ABD0J9C5_9CAEN